MIRMRALSRLVVASAALPLFATLAPAQVKAPAPANKPPPKLVVFMAIDGFPQEQLLKYYDQFGDGGRPGLDAHPTTRSTPRRSRARAMIRRWISEVPSQIRSTRSSRKKRSAALSRM